MVRGFCKKITALCGGGVRLVTWLVVALPLGGAVLASLAPLVWPFELAAHFLLHFLLAASIFEVFVLVRGRWWEAATLPALLGLGIFCLASAAQQNAAVSENVSPESHSLRVLVFNVSSGNQDMDRTIAFLRQQDADVFGLIEINHRWANALEAAFPQHARTVVGPDLGAFGLALFSKMPQRNAKIVLDQITGVPSLLVEIDQGHFQVLLTHPYPPVTPLGQRQRDRQLEAAADLVAGLTGPVLAMGDFNATPWTYALGAFAQKANLRRSWPGWTRAATWPAWLGEAGIPIDTIWFSRHWSVKEALEVGPNLGSDHRPVSLRLVLGNPEF